MKKVFIFICLSSIIFCSPQKMDAVDNVNAVLENTSSDPHDDERVRISEEEGDGEDLTVSDETNLTNNVELEPANLSHIK